MMKYNFLEARSENGCENDIFWSEIGSGFGEQGGTPTPIIPRNPYTKKLETLEFKCS